MSSLAELRKELKDIRKSTVHPVSRMKKADLIAELAKHRGATLAIINREETGLDGIADLVVRRGIGDILGGATGVN